MKESLICSKCSKTWKRERSRGRKPHLCPTCLKSQSSISISSIAIPSSSRKPKASKVLSVVPRTKEKEKPVFNPPSRWQCSSCLVYVITEVVIYEPPTHSCKKRLKKTYPLEKVSKIQKP